MVRSLPVRNLCLYKETDCNKSGALSTTVTTSLRAPSRLWSLLVNILSYSILTESLLASKVPEDMCVHRYVCFCMEEKEWAGCFPAPPLESCSNPCIFSIINL